MMLSGNYLAALLFASLVMLSPLIAMAALKRVVLQTVFRRTQCLLSGPAMNWPTMERVGTAKPKRFPHVLRLLQHRRFDSLRHVAPQTRLANVASCEDYICIAKVAK